ncbi:hypothetical protein TWF730_001239 [Orbilia blumenaviensis]|uniref:DUF1754-domain-containing protein n=1 Tax=Orbilia blumenaviensis TaxID=1796055 RepID=A0AAV9VQW6_9PEZI
MAKDDYATSGGPLRLKGSAGVVKHKSKKKTKSSKLSKSEEIARKDPKDSLEADEPDGPSAPTNKAEKETYQRKPKTEAERKFEEARKKKLDQLLLKDAAKSHKERVEEFNKYLSNLSEHHDMPRIGPG